MTYKKTIINDICDFLFHPYVEDFFDAIKLVFSVETKARLRHKSFEDRTALNFSLFPFRFLLLPLLSFLFLFFFNFCLSICLSLLFFCCTCTLAGVVHFTLVNGVDSKVRTESLRSMIISYGWISSTRQAGERHRDRCVITR